MVRCTSWFPVCLVLVLWASSSTAQSQDILAQKESPEKQPSVTPAISTPTPTSSEVDCNDPSAATEPDCLSVDEQRLSKSKQKLLLSDKMDKDDSGTGGQVGLAEPPKKSKIVKKGRLPDEEEAERPLETESEAKTSSAKPSVSKKELQDDEEEVESTTLPIAITAQSLDISSQSRHRSVVPKKGVEEEHGDTENKNETTPVSTATEKQLLASENPAAAEATAAPIPKQSSRNLNGVEPTTGRPSIVTTPPPKSIRISAEVPKSKPISHLAHDNSEAGQGVSDPSTPDTSLLVGLIFAVILVSVVGFLGIKRLNAIKRRREYRKMNDFLIDGMYNDL